MSEKFTFTAKLRDRVGKGASRALRLEGLIPASLYGDKKEVQSISICPKELRTQYGNSSLFSTIFTVDINGKKSDSLIRDIQFHPVKDTPMHIDFMRIGKNTTLKVTIPVTLINEDKCPGIKLGGSLNFIAHSIEVVCNPKDAPHSIVLDLAEATVGTVVKIEDINLPKNVKTYYPEGYPIYSITAPNADEDASDKEDESTQS